MVLSQFQNDLQNKGIPCEEEVLKILKRYDSGAKRSEGYDCDKDITTHFGERTVLFEVKNCETARVNVPVELAIDGKPTGINKSKSDYWVFYCKKAYHFIHADILKDLIKDIEAKEYDLFGQKVLIKSLPIISLKKWSVLIV